MYSRVIRVEAASFVHVVKHAAFCNCSQERPQLKGGPGTRSRPHRSCWPRIITFIFTGRQQRHHRRPQKASNKRRSAVARPTTLLDTSLSQ